MQKLVYEYFTAALFVLVRPGNDVNFFQQLLVKHTPEHLYHGIQLISKKEQTTDKMEITWMILKEIIPKETNQNDTYSIIPIYIAFVK